jgi:hypothetical protein
MFRYGILVEYLRPSQRVLDLFLLRVGLIGEEFAFEREEDIISLCDELIGEVVIA